MVRVLPESKNFLGITSRVSSYEASDIVVVSAPYEHTVSYGGGTRKGPSAILEASHYVEFWDEDFQRELCFDHGIATLPALAFGKARNVEALMIIEEAVRSCLNDGKFVVTLGGEHTVSAASIRAHFDRFPQMSLLQFDAHSDLRDSYEGSPYSHASVMARVIEFFPPRRIVQVGIRAQARDEFETIRQKKIKTFFAHDIHKRKHGVEWQKKVLDALGDLVYITFDLDYFDPSLLPATGTPEPGGFQWDETIQLVKEIGSKKEIIGFDVVELAPIPSLPFSSFIAARLVYKMLNAAFQHR